VHAINLLFTDAVLHCFDTNYKIMPPLRTQHDIDSLITGLKDNTIDVICTDHTPHDTESKVTEFDIAAFGMTGLETFFPVVLKALNGKLTLEEIIHKIAVNPRVIFNIQPPVIDENQPANVTVFSPSEKWTFEAAKGLSKSVNTPFSGFEFKGKAIQTVYHER
jgi:dihydroorotase